MPVAVARAEVLPFADGSFDAVCGAQMWHWVDVPAAAAEVRRVLRPGGWLAVWWNDVAADREQWFDRLDWPSYDRWLRSKSYVAALPDVEEFVAGERAGLHAAFPDGVIRDPFRTRLRTCWP